MLERRKFIRIPQSVKITYAVANNPHPGSSVIRNISKGGINFYAAGFIPVGTILKVQFVLKELSYDGFVKVVWVTEEPRNERYMTGAIFTSMPKVA